MITVHEVLALKRFNNFRLVAGANGLDRAISKGGFIDHETADVLHLDAVVGEMIFSNLPMIKDQPEEIYAYVKALIESDTSCFAIKTVFFNEIPQDAIDLANQHNYPLFLFNDTYIEQLILDIDEVVNDQKRLNKKISLVDEILSETLSEFQIKHAAQELNKFFKPYVMACMVKSIDMPYRIDIKSIQKLLGKEHLVLPYHDKVLVIMTSQKDDINAIQITHLLGDNGYMIGMSQIHHDLLNLKRVIDESFSALKYARFADKPSVRFQDMGLYQLLIDMMDQPSSYYYYTQYIEVLKQYDEKHQSDLLSTAIAYIKADGDIKASAEILFQHQNTVRYRIRKINEILNVNQLSGMAYESLAVAVHLYELNNNRDKLSLL